ncbi:MAG TPA: sigma-70 family RNA polymerase sigma factor [Planctomycetota bacterium]
MDPLAASFERFRRHGDLQALGHVFDALAPRLLSVALHLCGNTADAEDVLQQTFLLAMERDVGFDPARRLEPFLAGLLHNVARNARRSTARRRTEPLPELACADAGPIATAEREELLTLLRTNVDALPVEQRQVLRLQLQHGLSPAEIAMALEVPPGTVRMRIHRGIEALRKLLPAGLAVSVFAAFAERGLAAVKQQVMSAGRAHAAAVAAGSASAAVFGGVLLMKKLAITLMLAIAIAFVAWISWDGEPAAAHPGVQANADPRMIVAAVPHTAAPSAGNEATGERSAPAASTGALRVRVTVRTNSGSNDEVVPVAGTWLAVWAGGSPLVPYDADVLRAATDAAGEAVFTSLTPGPWHAQLVAETDAEPQRVAVTAGEETLLPFERTVKRVVRGVVVSADGAPVSGAEVWVHRGTAMGRYSTPERAELESRRAAVTGDDGRFAVPLLRREDRIAACREGHGESFAANASQEQDVRLVLGRTFATLGGVVRDSKGAPVANALVRFTPAGRDTRRAADGTLLSPRVDRLTRTDADGRFRFDGIAPGRVRAWATAWPLNPAWKELDVAPFGMAEVALQLKDGVSVVGTVRYADGTPARVGVHSTPSLDNDGHYCHCETREDGSYELYYQPRRRFFVVVGRQKRVASREFADPECGIVRCDFVLEGNAPAPVAAPVRTAKVRGRLVDVDGAPIAAKEVALRLQERGEEGERIAATASDGTFSFGDLEPDAFTLVADRGSAAMRELAQFEALEGRHYDLGDLVLAPTASLRVHVVRADGSPWRGPMPYVRLTDAKGSRLDRTNEPVPGGLRLQVWPGQFTVHTEGTDLIAAPQQVELTPGVETEVRVPVAIGRSRQLVWNGDGAHKPQRNEVLHVTVREAGGAVVVQRDVKDLLPDLRGFRYWYLSHVFAFGRYEVEAHSDSGLRYRGVLDVRDDVDDPTRVDVPRMAR